LQTHLPTYFIGWIDSNLNGVCPIIVHPARRVELTGEAKSGRVKGEAKMKEKIKEKEELRRIIENLKAEGKRIVFTNGCFDLLHIGHLRYLEKAKTFGDILVVGINSDPSVRSLKGAERPLLPADERAEILSGLGCVDFVTVFDELNPFNLISLIQPHILVKGGDWTKETIIGKEVVERSGGQVVIISFVEGASTSRLIETILKRYAKRT
jgi:D-beta-D-heptose 7-phosphate kinase / D-beta-D-heptose 1-phosphate adenosyltransferase